MRFGAFVTFAVSFTGLVATQIILRKLALIFPVDLSAYAITLAIQFGAMATGFALFGWMPRIAAHADKTGVLLILQTLALPLIFLSGPLLITGSVLFFFFSALLAGHFLRSLPQTTRANFFIYAGSALGLLIAEKVFFRFFSLLQVTAALASLQVILAGICFLPPTKQTTTRDEAGESSIADDSAKGISAFVAGFILFSGVIVSYRLLRIYLRDTADVVAEVTTISMLVGALVSIRFTSLVQSAVSKFIVLLAGPLLFATCTVSLHRMLAVPREFFILFLLLGVSAWAAFLYNEALVAARSRGQLYRVLLWNTVGSFCGALGFAYWIVPVFKLERAFAIFLILFLAATLWLLIRPLKQIKKKTVRGLALAALAFVTLLAMPLPFATDWYQNQTRALVQRVGPGETFVASLETPQDLWVLTEKKTGHRRMHHRLIHNSHSMSGTHFASRRYMKLMAYLGYFHNTRAKTALNIGFGTGLTAQALLENKYLQSLDVIDVTREITKLTQLIYDSEKSPDPNLDPRLHYHLGGARHFLRETRQRYDIITGEPPPPSNSSIAYLYTADFYREVAAHLSAGGVFTYWLPTHSVSDAAAEKIWNTFRSVFPQHELYAGTESNLIMVGYNITNGTSPLSADKLSPNAELIDGTIARETHIASFAELKALRITPKQKTASEHVTRILTDNDAYIEEDYARSNRKPWGLPDLTSRPQVYAADVTANPYVALVALERLLPTKPNLATVEYLLVSEDALKQPLAAYLYKGDYSAAQKLLRSHPDKIHKDELICAWMILLDRLTMRDSAAIKRDAIAYARSRGGVSPVFRAYVDRKLPPEFYGN